MAVQAFGQAAQGPILGDLARVRSWLADAACSTYRRCAFTAIAIVGLRLLSSYNLSATVLQQTGYSTITQKRIVRTYEMCNTFHKQIQFLLFLLQELLVQKIENKFLYSDFTL